MHEKVFKMLLRHIKQIKTCSAIYKTYEILVRSQSSGDEVSFLI